MDNVLLLNKITSLPESLQSEVQDFIDFLAAKTARKQQKAKPVFGSDKGMFVIRAGFDEPLEDFKDYRFSDFKNAVLSV